ncbi:transposase family protein [Streptomyces sp. NPDC050704]|uniref:transposase family protein n=1 Tax=Streptomyces sp. NPDC050704 TaxID=3157219 RepID=UPI003442C3CA
MSADRRCGRLWTVMVLVMQTDAPFWDSLVFDGIDHVDVEAVTAAFGTVEVVARGHAAGAACPDCGRFSERVHDRYQRRRKDLPLAEQSFVIKLTVRCFICGAADCPRRTFVEPFSRLAAPHAWFATRLNHALERVGLALAGRVGTRPAVQLGFGTGRLAPGPGDHSGRTRPYEGAGPRDPGGPSSRCGSCPPAKTPV